MKKIQAQNKKKEYSFKLSDKDIFIAEQERNDERNDEIERILQDDMLKDYPAIDNTYSLAFKFLHWVNHKGKDKVPKSFSIAPLSCLKPVYIRLDNTALKMLSANF